MKKNLLIISMIFLCSCNYGYSSSNTSSNSPSICNQKILLSVFQVYEEIYESNIWSNPRFDIEFEFTINDIVNISSISENFRPQYQCYGDGYFWYENFWFNISPLEEAENEFIIIQDTNLYYGCRG